jgi:hypothetical protein
MTGLVTFGRARQSRRQGRAGVPPVLPCPGASEVSSPLTIHCGERMAGRAKGHRGWLCAAVIFGLTPILAPAGAPVVLSLEPNAVLRWTSPLTNGLAVIEASSNLQAGSWSPFVYDLASNFQPLPALVWLDGIGLVETNYNYHEPSQVVRTTQLPAFASSQAFYRLSLRTNPPDPNLVLHLTFDNDLSQRALLDSSGYGNHALQYSPTNWPGSGLGPDGSRAGLFSGPRLMPGSEYSQGDYAGIPYSPSLDHLSNGTVLAWAFYDVTSYHNSTIVDNSLYGTDRASWSLGRTYSYNTYFEIGVGNGGNSTYTAVIYPDFAPGGGTTGGWHYYGATWDGTNITGYFDGLPCSSGTQAGFPELVIGTAGWTAIGCKIHAGTPQWGDADALPNWGWLGGEIDDVRIYNRALGAAEILNLYASFDHESPSPPANVRVAVDSSTQAEVRWDAATDNCRVDGYRILRNGLPQATNAAPGCYVDSDLSPNTTYRYTLQAFDPARNFSTPSAPVAVTTPGSGSPVNVIVDNADGPPWVNVTGGPWTLYSGTIVADSYGPDVLSCNETGTGSVEFRPHLPESGAYSVYLWHPGSDYWYDFSAAAPLDVVHSGTTQTVSMNEQTHFGMWNYVGTFACSAGTNNLVRVRPSGASVTPADAVRFVK